MPNSVLQDPDILSLENLEAIAQALDGAAQGGQEASDSDAGESLAEHARRLRTQAHQIDLHLRSVSLIAALSSRLLNVPMSSLEAGLRDGLEELGESAGTQRAYVFLLSEDSQHLTDAYEWVADGVEGHDFDAFRGVSVDAFPWSMDHFRRGETVLVTDPDSLPERADPERGACEALSILSYVNMPLLLDQRVLGWLGFDSVGTDKTWSETELRLMEIARDVITTAIQRKRREELLFRQRELSQRVTSMGILAAGLAHEINNPLSFVIGNLAYLRETLQQDDGDDARDDMRDAIQQAREGADRVRQVVGDLRALAHGEDTEIGEVDLESIVNATVRMASNQLRHRARVVRNYAGVPAVKANASQLGQVLLNLVINASQAIPEGRAPDNEVEINARAENDHVTIEIRDTGCGIAAEILPRIFDPFYTTRDIGEGMGIGLAVCHNIVKSFGGTIQVDSEVGVGTTVTLTLPRAESAPVENVEKKPRILLVDDEQRILDMCARFLRGNELVLAKNGREALAKLEKSSNFDVILCDVMMPDIGGIEVYKTIASQHPGLEQRIIFISGGSLSSEIDGFLRSVPNELLRKPFEPQALRDLVAAILDPE